MIIAFNTSPSASSIGEGIYLTQDIALILNVPYANVRHWRSEIWDKKLNKGTDFKYSFGDEKNKAVNFYTLIELYTFFKLREKGLSAKKIIKVHQTIGEELNTKYPFAIAEILADKKGVWYKHLENLITADGTRQINIKPILEPFLEKVEFSKASGIAERYYPLGKAKKVVVDPKHQFGQPVVSDTNIKTEVIYQMYKGGESVKNISYIYDINSKYVSDAIGFHKTRI